MSEEVDARVRKARSEATEFLAILEERVAGLTCCNVSFDAGNASISFNEYRKFRDGTSECLTFVIIIENRLGRLSDAVAKPIRQRLDEMTAKVWAFLLDGALHFFEAIVKINYLPLGSREVFVRELKTLHEAETLLSDERFKRWIDDSARRKLKTASRILAEIIERAPSLLEIGRSARR